RCRGARGVHAPSRGAARGALCGAGARARVFPGGAPRAGRRALRHAALPRRARGRLERRPDFDRFGRVSVARIGARSVAVLAVCLVTALARAGRATETEIHGRLAWVLGDADLTRPARSSAPSSRGLVAGDQPGYALFFDGLAAR